VCAILVAIKPFKRIWRCQTLIGLEVGVLVKLSLSGVWGGDKKRKI